MARKSFGFKDTYSIDAEMKAQEWQASSMVAEKQEGQDGEEPLSLQARQLKSAEEYAQTLVGNETDVGS